MKFVRKIVGACLRSLARRLGHDFTKSCLVSLVDLMEYDLLALAYRSRGILKYENMDVSGENHALRLLAQYFQKKGIVNPVVFDVGANVGTYSLSVKTTLPEAQVYAFEPNPPSFKKLRETTQGRQVTCTNIGFAQTPGKLSLYHAAGDDCSELASVFRNYHVLSHHKNDAIQQVEIDVTTVDAFCRDFSIPRVDFLKIDTEGSELSVLQGALDTLERASFVQFEFNEINVISRVFLRDFYHTLPKFRLYRLDSARLIPLTSYSFENEIFRYQNILGVHNSVAAEFELGLSLAC